MCEKYEDKYVVFIDILGFKKLIDGDESEAKSASEIGKILDYFLPTKFKEFIQHSFSNEEYADEEFDLTSLQITNFSDCLVISFGDQENLSMNADIAYYVIEAIANISMILVRDHQVHLRGGMAFGKVCHCESKVYGPAVNHAYKIESEYSKYPRILIEGLELPDTDALGFQKTHKLIKPVYEKGSNFLELNIANTISYTKNTRYDFNDYVRSFREKHKLSTDNDLKEVINSCRSLLSEIENNPSFYENESSLKVWQKHKWIVDKLDSMDV